MAETTDLQRLVISLEANLKKYEKEMARANGIAADSTRRVARDFDRMNGNISTGFSKLAVAAASAFSVAALAAFSKKAIEAADAIAESAERIGISTDSLQELSYAAKLAGVETEQFEQAMLGLSRRLGGTQDEIDDVTRALNKLGFSTADLRGKKADEVFKMLADRIAAIKDPMQQSILAADLFGARVGQRLLPTLRLGSSELARLAAEAHKMGLVLSRDTLEQAGKAADEFDRIGLALRAAGINISVGMLPAITELRKLLTDQGFQDGANRLGAAIGEMIRWMVDNKDTILTVTAALGGAFAGRMFGPAGAAIGAFSAVVALAAATAKEGLKDVDDATKSAVKSIDAQLKVLEKRRDELTKEMMRPGNLLFGGEEQVARQKEYNDLVRQSNELIAQAERLIKSATGARSAATTAAVGELDRLIKKQAELDAQMKEDRSEAELASLLEQYKKVGAEIERLKTQLNSLLERQRSLNESIKLGNLDATALEEAKRQLAQVTQEIEKLRSSAPQAGAAVTGVAAQIAAAMKEAGFQTHQIAAALAAAKRESNFNPAEFNPDDKGMPSFGLFQWRDRLDALKTFAADAKMNIDDVRTQVAFFIHELRNGEKAAGDMLRAAGSPEAAAQAMAAFERFAGWNKEGNKELAQRIALTRQYFDMLSKGMPLQINVGTKGPAADEAAAAMSVFKDDALVKWMEDAAVKTRIARGEFSALGDEFVEAAMKLPLTRQQLLLFSGDIEKLPALIRQAVAASRELQQAQDLRKAADDFGKAFGRAFEDAILKAKSFEDVLKSLGQEVARLMLRLLITNTLERSFRSAFLGLGSLFGIGGGGPGAPLPIGPTGMTPTAAPSIGPPQPIIPATVEPTGRQPAPTLMNITTHIDARGADAAAVARLERGLDERDRKFARNVGAVMHTRQVRKVRY